MRKLKTAFLALTAFSLLLAVMIDFPVQAICCKGAVKSGGVCLGDNTFRIVSTSPTMTSAQCITDTKDYYGVIIPCIFTTLDSTSPPCY